MNSKTYILFFLIIFGFSLNSLSQISKKTKKSNSYFGIQYKPIIPTNILSNSTLFLENGNFTSEINQKFGYSFGGVVRVGITKLISLETGINMVQRNFSIDYNLPDSNLFASDNFGIVTYDLPVNGLFYIQLDENKFMNTSLGFSMVYSPSNVSTRINPNGKHLFIHEGRRNGKGDLFMFSFDINANVGFELRTQKNGIFYVGASAKIPIKPIYYMAAVHEYGSNKIVAADYLKGSYMTLDFRYFFKNATKAGSPVIKGPIEQ